MLRKQTLLLIALSQLSFTLVAESPQPKPKQSPSPFASPSTVETPPTPQDYPQPFKKESEQKEEVPDKPQQTKEAPPPEETPSSSPQFANPFLRKAPSKKKNPPKAKPFQPQKRVLLPSIRSDAQVDAPAFNPDQSNTQPNRSYTITETPSEKAETHPKPPASEHKATKEKPKSTQSKTSSSEGYVVNFNKIDIKEFLRFIGEATKTNFVFHEEDLKAKRGGGPITITVISEAPTPIEELMTILLQILQANGLSLIDQGDNILISKSSSPTKLAQVVTGDEGVVQAKLPLITRIFTLDSAYAPQVASIIRSMLSSNALLEVSPGTNQLILTDFSKNIERVESLIQALDRPHGGMEVGKYNAEMTPASELVSTAEQILLPLSDGKPLVLVPHTTSDSIFIVSTPEMISKAIKILTAIDVNANISSGILSGEIVNRSKAKGQAPSLPKLTKEEKEKLEEDPEAGFRVYKLRHHKGNTIAASLNEIGKSLGAAGVGGEEMTRAISSMRWIPSSNSLIVTGPKHVADKVYNLITTLDSPLRQVFIEMLILETSVQKSFSFGVQWGAQGQSSDGRFGGAVAQSFSSGGGSDILNVIGNKQVSELSSGLGLGVFGDVLVHNGQPLVSMGAMIDALQNDSETTILMNPRIITQDAKSAEIFVGENIPYKSATIQPNIGEATTEFQYRNVGTRLVITPYLGNSDLVTLEISQDISEVADQEQNDQTLLYQNTPKSRTTSTQTTVHVPDNHFLMISGMIRSAEVKGKAGIPCLGGVPAVGSLLSGKNYTKQKSNVIIFIRPHIISTVEEMTRVTRDQEKRFDENIKFRPFEEEKEEFLDVMDMYDY